MLDISLLTRFKTKIMRDVEKQIDTIELTPGPKGDTGPQGPAGTHYASCTTSGSTYSKTASVTGFSLVTGVRVSVKFSYAHTSGTAATLNISSTGAKMIRAYDGSNYANVTNSFSWKANEIVEMVYDGSYWIVTASSMDFAPRHNINGGTF